MAKTAPGIAACTCEKLSPWEKIRGRQFAILCCGASKGGRELHGFACFEAERVIVRCETSAFGRGAAWRALYAEGVLQVRFAVLGSS